MTGTGSSPTVRRLAALAAATVAFLSVTLLAAGPATAAVPEGWPDTPPIDTLEMLAVLGGIPLLLTVLIVAYVYLPDLIRGERVAPGATGPEDQWLGGRRSTGELAAPAGDHGDHGDRAEAADGGASARW